MKTWSMIDHLGQRLNSLYVKKDVQAAMLSTPKETTPDGNDVVVGPSAGYGDIALVHPAAIGRVDTQPSDIRDESLHPRVGDCRPEECRALLAIQPRVVEVTAAVASGNFE